MVHRFAKPIGAVALLLALWALNSVRDGGPREWAHPAGAPVPVRILRFYASAGTIAPGEAAQLCYEVANARSVRISPMLPGVYPSVSHCLDVRPEHTTHYTILAEGYDGGVAVRSVTLEVEDAPGAPPRILQFALSLPERAMLYNLRSSVWGGYGDHYRGA